MFPTEGRAGGSRPEAGVYLEGPGGPQWMRGRRGAGEGIPDWALQATVRTLALTLSERRVHMLQD